ncbi:MAG: serine/threonine-protein kinase, partial [Gemmatimonadota bacterium]
AATAIAEQRFLREARLLARLRHPHVLSVHQAGTADGLLYFVMDFAGGETLAARLERGPLPPAQAQTITGQLLSALDAAHRLRIIHRDIKPANIFLDGDNALLGDFGIAHAESSGDSGAPLTEAGHWLGTLAYMSPEQLAGQAATESSDLYALAMVIYEMHTGRRWRTGLIPAAADWSGVPPTAVLALSRALALAPEDRWADVAAWAVALGGRPKRPVARLIALTGVALVAALAVVFGVRGSTPVMATLVVGSFGDADPEGPAAALRTSLHRALVGVPYFQLGIDRPAGPGEMLVDGRVERSADTWRVDAFFQGPGTARTPLPALSAPSAVALATALANEVLLLAMRQDDPWLPRDALPARPEGRALWAQAELHYAAGRWDAAAQAYLDAFRLDTTCLLCSYRYDDVRRWLGRSTDSIGRRRVRREIARFPPYYQRLIAADSLPMPMRLDSLAALVTGDYREFPLAWYRYGSELYNRGPLYGHDRLEARAVLEQATRLRPGFHGPWYDLATLLIAEGDSAAARVAMRALGSLPVEGLARARKVFVDVGFALRFGAGADRGLAEVGAALADSSVLRLPEIAAGPRALTGYGSPEGAMVLGRAFGVMAPGGPLHYSGLVARALGASALGQRGEVEQAVEALRAGFPAAPVDDWVPRLLAVHQVFDEGPPDSPEAVDRLLAAASTGSTSQSRWNTAWIRVALRGRLGDSVGARQLLGQLDDEPAPRARSQLARAWLAASSAQLPQAIRLADALLRDPEIIEGEAYGDLFLRSGLMLSLAEWYARQGNMEAARRVLRWHQHFHLTDYPTAEPLSAEVDWSLGTVARWRAARLLDRGGRDVELCRAYRVVAEQWAMGDPEFKFRADLAGQRLAALGCGSF